MLVDIVQLPLGQLLCWTFFYWSTAYKTLDKNSASHFIVVKGKVERPQSSKSMGLFPSVLWHCWLGDRKGIRTVEKLGVGLLVMMIWLELCTTYSSSCHHHFQHPEDQCGRYAMPCLTNDMKHRWDNSSIQEFVSFAGAITANWTASTAATARQCLQSLGNDGETTSLLILSDDEPSSASSIRVRRPSTSVSNDKQTNSSQAGNCNSTLDNN